MTTSQGFLISRTIALASRHPAPELRASPARGVQRTGRPEADRGCGWTQLNRRRDRSWGGECAVSLSHFLFPRRRGSTSAKWIRYAHWRWRSRWRGAAERATLGAPCTRVSPSRKPHSSSSVSCGREGDSPGTEYASGTRSGGSGRRDLRYGSEKGSSTHGPSLPWPWRRSNLPRPIS